MAYSAVPFDRIWSLPAAQPHTRALEAFCSIIMQAPKRLASLCQGRVALLDHNVDVDVGDIKDLVALLVRHRNNHIDCRGIGEEIRRTAHTQLGVQGTTPHKDILEALLCIVDVLVGGNGSVEALRNGTSRLYAEGHLHPRVARRGIRTYLVKGYMHIDLGLYGLARRRIRVPMHRIMCWLRWGNPSDSSAVVCHDIACPRRDCVGLACLRWDTVAANARDRVRKGALRGARQGRAAPGVARESERSHQGTGYNMVWVHVRSCCLRAI